MEYLLASIQIWAPNFAPKGFAYCNGALLAIAQNSALYSLLGTTYGGDGVTTFGLPDLRSRVPLGAGMGTGPGLSTYRLGEKGGIEEVTLNQATMPQHTHSAQGQMRAYNETATQHDAQAGSVLASAVYNDGRDNFNVNMYAAPTGPAVSLSPASLSLQLGNAGGSLPHENRMPYEGLSFIIAMVGIYPARN